MSQRLKYLKIKTKVRNCCNNQLILVESIHCTGVNWTTSKLEYGNLPWIAQHLITGRHFAGMKYFGIGIFADWWRGLR
jgi:hypothetical protein